jgi:hypothetical protein
MRCAAVQTKEHPERHRCPRGTRGRTIEAYRIRGDVLQPAKMCILDGRGDAGLTVTGGRYRAVRFVIAARRHGEWCLVGGERIFLGGQ